MDATCQRLHRKHAYVVSSHQVAQLRLIEVQGMTLSRRRRYLMAELLLLLNVLAEDPVELLVLLLMLLWTELLLELR